MNLHDGLKYINSKLNFAILLNGWLDHLYSTLMCIRLRSSSNMTKCYYKFCTILNIILQIFMLNTLTGHVCIYLTILHAVSSVMREAWSVWLARHQCLLLPGRYTITWIFYSFQPVLPKDHTLFHECMFVLVFIYILTTGNIRR